jgi:PKD repeat protein
LLLTTGAAAAVILIAISSASAVTEPGAGPSLSGPAATCPNVANTPTFTIAYGPVQIDGVDAPVGTVVEAVSPREEIVGCFEVTSAGHYGAMYVYGEDQSVAPPIPGMKDGEPVTFRVNGLAATASPALLWHNDRASHLAELTARSPGQYLAEYYNNRYLSDSPTFTRREDPPINYDWGNGGPGNGVESDNFSVRWAGAFRFDAGTYTFTAVADDGVRVWVDGGSPIIDAWKDQPPTEYGSARTLTAGQHEVKMEYYEHTVGAVARLNWNVGDPLAGYTFCANEYQRCSFSGAKDVAYGADGRFTYKTNITDGIDCTNAVFGDPIPGVYKACYTRPSAPPTADFYAAPVSGGSPLTVTFHNTSTGSYSTCSWNYGDGSTLGTSCAASHTHTYTSAGRYTVSLTIEGTGAAASTKTRADYITVGLQPSQYLAEYFNNRDLSGSPTFARYEDAPIDYDWGNGGPGNGIGNDNFSARWTGRFHIDAGTYAFIARSDDGIRVWLGNDQIINSWVDRSPTEDRVIRTVVDGDYDLRVEYYERGGGAVAQFRWEQAGGCLIESSHPYRDNYNNTWTLTNPDASAAATRIHFSRLETEAGYDYVRVRDANGNQINRFDGVHASGEWSSTVSGRIVKVQLTSDDGVTAWGFCVDRIETVGAGLPPAAE